MESSHKPSRVKICDGMCNACGAEGCNLRVGPCGRQTFGCKFRVVVCVDQIMRDSWVFRIGAIQRLKQSGRLFLPRMRLVGRRCIRQQCERVKHLGFDIVPVAEARLLIACS